jgi:hypothetical protein
MKRYALYAVALSALVVTSSLIAADKIKLDGIKCVVSGGPAKDIDGSSVDYKGGKVFFCCNNCPKAYGKDKAKFSTKANHQLAATGQAKEVKCPLTGRDLNPDAVVEIGGVKVAFCCNNCKGKAAAATGDDQINLVFSDKAFDTGFKVPKAEKK